MFSKLAHFALYILPGVIVISTLSYVFHDAKPVEFGSLLSRASLVFGGIGVVVGFLFGVLAQRSAALRSKSDDGRAAKRGEAG